MFKKVGVKSFTAILLLGVSVTFSSFAHASDDEAPDGVPPEIVRWYEDHSIEQGLGMLADSGAVSLDNGAVVSIEGARAVAPRLVHEWSQEAFEGDVESFTRPVVATDTWIAPIVTGDAKTTIGTVEASLNGGRVLPGTATAGIYLAKELVARPDATVVRYEGSWFLVEAGVVEQALPLEQGENPVATVADTISQVSEYHDALLSQQEEAGDEVIFGFHPLNLTSSSPADLENAQQLSLASSSSSEVDVASASQDINMPLVWVAGSLLVLGLIVTPFLIRKKNRTRIS